MEPRESTFQASDWLSLNEGRLSVDVLENAQEIVVRSAIAGVRAEDLEINLSEDTLTIRGTREHGCEEETQGDVHVQECHWGSFSRTIILPTRIDPASVDAVLKRGILTIRMKKVEIDRNVPILELDDV
ncbi:Hsp20/alpha crystallin family protein [Candidatus Uhrbacteria bacterium]|nr:Hsp20/alpha crystallin family protein [Candidatus Uhrbacteria bacterium]